MGAEIAESAAVPGTASPKEKCPFCHKKPPGHDAAFTGKPNQKIVSTPKSLGELTIPGVQAGRWGRARHHIIPAKQCFARVRRLARMALSAGYDINESSNGIGLPTVKNPYTHNGTTANFGKFGPAEKQEISFKMMTMSKKQWHVGNHSYEISGNPQDENENMADEGSINHQPYDKEVIKLLVRLMNSLVQQKLCDKKDQSDKVKNDVKTIESTIKGNLNAFASNPLSSTPFFVSRAALDFAHQ